MSSTVCLDIAIDHRICRLIKPSTNEKIQSDSAHILQLEELFRSLGDKDPCEFVTTADLAGPERKGGILVALERPANNHPFSDGTDVVVEGSPSLRALKDIFSLFDLSLVRDVSVIDAFPFLPKGNLGPVGTDSYKATSDLHFTYFLGAVVAKQPDVVLCMWKSPESPELKSFNCELQSKGIGQWFQQPKLIYSEMSGDQIDLVRLFPTAPGT
ncbi:hypothetical protein N7451_004072 [Penicillium sp. IBT 35674x]|nr:hypothetical protein N7451_004072 [Penicillium sp. IBT 35674x]